MVYSEEYFCGCVPQGGQITSRHPHRLEVAQHPSTVLEILVTYFLDISQNALL